MAVQIQDILALLPELFPGVQSIPLKNLSPDPENPGPPLTDQAIQDMADNLTARGLVNPIKVQGDKAKLFVEGVQPHPDNPRLRADGLPWTVGDFNYVILGGERRYRAADRLGWVTIPGFILNPSEEEAVEINYLDNDVRDRGWWAGYQTLEKLIKANPSLTQRQVGTRLKMDKDKVNRALRLLPLLNAEAKALIVCNTDNSNKGIWGISEKAASRLADLGPGSTLKPGVKKAGDESQKLWPYPAIPSETQDRVLRTLKVAIEGQMTEAGVKGLVRSVQEGHRPEDHQAKGSPKAPEKAADLETDEDDEDSVEPIPWYENSRHPEYLQIPISRIRVNDFVAQCYAHSLNVERKALSMQAIGFVEHIWVRRLTEAEKKADLDHDYELFKEISTLKGAEMLGWPKLNAMVFDIDEWEGIRLHNAAVQHSQPLTWVEVYAGMERILAEDPSENVGRLAVPLQEDPAVAIRVLPVMKLLNESTRIMIIESVHRCYEGRVNMGGYRFSKESAILLKRLEGISEDLLETQKLVEKVVRIAIEKEAWPQEFEEFVDWVLAGNDPDQYFEKEA
jgi:ParB family chromosome partitioning protein